MRRGTLHRYVHAEFSVGQVPIPRIGIYVGVEERIGELTLSIACGNRYSDPVWSLEIASDRFHKGLCAWLSHRVPRDWLW